MSRPIRRGRLDVLDHLRPGLADTVRARVVRSLPPGPDGALTAAAAALVDGPAPAALDAALDARDARPTAAADRLVVAAAGRVRAGGAPAPTRDGLVGVPADEAARLETRLLETPLQESPLQENRPAVSC